MQWVHHVGAADQSEILPLKAYLKDTGLDHVLENMIFVEQVNAGDDGIWGYHPDQDWEVVVHGDAAEVLGNKFDEVQWEIDFGLGDDQDPFVL